jgi:hypothetical protein
MLTLRHRWTFVKVGNFLNSSEAHHGCNFAKCLCYIYTHSTKSFPRTRLLDLAASMTDSGKEDPGHRPFLNNGRFAMSTPQ